MTMNGVILNIKQNEKSYYTRSWSVVVFKKVGKGTPKSNQIFRKKWFLTFCNMDELGEIARGNFNIISPFNTSGHSTHGLW